MKKQTFYPTIWSPMPLHFNLMMDRDHNGRRIKELILKNEMASELGVSEMELSILKFAAIDKLGNEHHILGFPEQTAVSIKGLSTGHFLRSSQVVKLQRGNYTKLRFYLGKYNKFTYSDGLVEDAYSFDIMDFSIENGLSIEANEATEIKLWFDFAPYKFSSHLKGLLDLFKGNQKPRPRLANGLGN